MSTNKTTPVAVIVGASTKYQSHDDGADLPLSVRWGLGGALSQRFAKSYTVVLMARRAEELRDLAQAIEGQGGRAIAVVCDVTDNNSVQTAFAQAAGIGPIEVVVYNVAPAFPPGVTFANLPLPHEVDPAYLNMALDIGVTGCLRCVRAVIPDMLAAGKGTILLSGATLALRGGALLALWSPVKFALRSLGQSLNQAYGAKGIHVAHVVIDGLIDSPALRHQFAGQEVAFLDPAEIADAYMMLVEQPKSCWSYELQLTPQGSSLGMRL
jgi:NAD(P)-dependent dehydrogenase (short-subunit alcohol dehydrogenase family)